jgi:hypothetical protein
LKFISRIERLNLGKRTDELSPQQVFWIEQQKLFFVATAPQGTDGHINCSPKGMDTFRVISPKEVAYLDLTGSGVETVAHLRDNGRIVIMFCAFEGPPKIVRLHGSGSVLTTGAEFQTLCGQFPARRGIRSVIKIDLTDVSDSCGYGVPRFDYVGERDTLDRWVAGKTDAELDDYRQQKNANSLDGLAGL